MASGIIESYVVPPGSTGAGAYWSFEWVSTKKSVGVSTVTWNLYTRGRYSSPTWLQTSCVMKVGKNGTTSQLYSGSFGANADGSFQDKWRASGSFDVTHEASGYASFSIYFDVAIYDGVKHETQTMGVLESNPSQAIITSAPSSFTDEDNPAIEFSNPAGTAVKALYAQILQDANHDWNLVYSRAIHDTTGTSYTFVLTDEEKKNLLQTMAVNEQTLYFCLRSNIGGLWYEDQKPTTFKIANPDPVLTTSVEDTNAATIALTGDKTKLVKGYSNAKVTMVAEAQKYSAIFLDSLIIRNGDNTIYGDSGVFENVESNTFVFSAEDSRYNVTQKEVRPTMVEYFKPTCLLGNNKLDGDGNITVFCSGNFFNGSFGAVSNTLTAQYRYKVYGGTFGAWTNMTVTKTGNRYTASAYLTGLNYKNTYVFETQVTDKLNTVSSNANPVSSFPVFHWGKNDFVFEVPVSVNGDQNITGNLRLKGDGNYGNYLYFGDGSYTYIAEPTDDALTIYAANSINLQSKEVKINGTSFPKVESGVWIPALVGGGVSYYSNYEGWYQRVGNVVTIGWNIKCVTHQGANSIPVEIAGVPYTPSYSAFGGGVAFGIYIAGNFNFEGWAINTSGKITPRLQPCNNTTTGELNISSSAYLANSNDMTLAGTICYLTN